MGHISRDSTDIIAREKPVSQEKPKKKKSKRKHRRPKKGETVFPKEQTRIEKQKAMTLEEMLADLPTVCDRGTKKTARAIKNHGMVINFTLMLLMNKSLSQCC